MKFSRLNYLRVFEAAARLGGFLAAARELGVTPAAVSYQIRSLEAQCHVKLFRRSHRSVELTSAGQTLLLEVKKGLVHFERGFDKITADGLRGKLAVNVAPSLAQQWLMPLLGDFIEKYPEIDLQVSASEEPPNLFLEQVDIRLVHGSGRFPDLNSKRFLSEIVTPVCSPKLITQTPINAFADLQHHVLLHDTGIGDEETSVSWRRWLSDEGLDYSLIKRHLSFDSAVLMLEAAVAGYGVALGRSMLTAPLLASGELICPLDSERPAERAYYSVATEAAASRPRVKAFRDWLHSQDGF